MTELVGKRIRKLIKLGNCLVLTLPTEYVRLHDLKPGDLMEIGYNSVIFGQKVSLEKLGQSLEATKAAMTEAETPQVSKKKRKRRPATATKRVGD